MSKEIHLNTQNEEQKTVLVTKQILELNEFINNAKDFYDLSCIDGLYEFSHEVWNDFGAEIEFNEGMPIEWCVSAEINEPLNNWRLSKFKDLEYINFDNNACLIDFSSEKFGLEETKPDVFFFAQDDDDRNAIASEITSNKHESDKTRDEVR